MLPSSCAALTRRVSVCPASRLGWDPAGTLRNLAGRWSTLTLRCNLTQPCRAVVDRCSFHDSLYGFRWKSSASAITTSAIGGNLFEISPPGATSRAR